MRKPLSESDRRLNVESRLLAIVSTYGGERIVAGAAMERMVAQLADEVDTLAREGFLPERTTQGSHPLEVHGAASGCDDCSVEPGERHRYAGCPGNRRAAEREAATQQLKEGGCPAFLPAGGFILCPASGGDHRCIAMPGDHDEHRCSCGARFSLPPHDRLRGVTRG